MRWMALACLLLMSGCTASGPVPETVAVAILSGEIRESGPAYEYHGGVCGRALNTFELREAERELWYTKEYNRVSPGSNILVVQNVPVRSLQSGGCAGPGFLVGLADAGNLSYGISEQRDTKQVAREGKGLRAEGAPLTSGASVTWPFHAVVVRHATEGDRREGTYTYAGNVTLRYLGAWPSSQVHEVARCDQLPEGC